MLSVVMPAFNEEQAIFKTITDVESELKSAGYTEFEILVVDDASEDATAEIAAKTGVRVISKLENHGYGHSLKIGIRESKYNLIVIMDADGTYPVNAIPQMIKIFQQGFDMVVGKRTGPNFRAGFVKHPLRVLLKFLVEFGSSRKIPDPNSGLRIFSREDILPLLPKLCDRFSFTTSMTLAYMMLERDVKYHDISYNKRIGRSKVRLFQDSFITLLYIVQAVNFYNPIKIFLVLAGFTALIGLILSVVGLLLTITTFIQLGIATLTSAIIVFAIGLVADLLKQIRKSN